HVNSVSVEAQKPVISCSTCCAKRGIAVQLGNNYIPATGSVTPINLASISSTAMPSGNGIMEDTMVHSTNMRLQSGVPLEFDRILIAKDTATLSQLISGGHWAQALIELVDSATHNVQVVLDSFTVAHAHDTVDHEGTIVYYPADTILPKTVYVRARIIADTNKAKWDVQSEMQFETSDTLGSGLLKPITQQNQSALLPTADNALALDVYPNPFNPKTNIMFTIPVEDANDITNVKVYDLMGNDVTMLVHDIKPAGRYAVEFDGSHLPSGRYIVAVKTQNHEQSKLIILQK
ncbi:MAG TPA: T9SS type A sorting domain-containing protein, partial [Candidatus Kapabacteria bacterium]|nr:T9SS type A sorting domain-containing protein [Candidatus Kapabacteria bacterium]